MVVSEYINMYVKKHSLTDYRVLTINSDTFRVIVRDDRYYTCVFDLTNILNFNIPVKNVWVSFSVKVPDEPITDKAILSKVLDDYIDITTEFKELDCNTSNRLSDVVFVFNNNSYFYVSAMNLAFIYLDDGNTISLDSF